MELTELFAKGPTQPIESPSIPKIAKIRVNIFRNGSKVDGKVIFVRKNWDKFVRSCGKKLGYKDAKRIFNKEGISLTTTKEIVPNEVLFVSEGEEFKPLPVPISARKGGGDWVTLNVGGTLFSTTRSTLTREPGSMLERLFSDEWDPQRDENGAYLIDRSPVYFAPILHYLRCGKLVVDDSISIEGVLKEVQFYKLTSLLGIVQEMVDNEKRLRLTDVIAWKDLCKTSAATQSLRCQGLNLTKVDLSKLDLSNINFKMSCLEGANLEKANLDNALLQEANLSYANLQGASLRGANLARANMQMANLKGSNLEDRGGLKANLEGASLKGAILEDCNFSGANLRAANLRGSTMENANLHRADLAGADLEGVNLLGANLYKANVNGANLHGANFDIRTVSSRHQ